jgi:CheY-like chemotaxis protein
MMPAPYAGRNAYASFRHGCLAGTQLALPPHAGDGYTLAGTTRAAGANLGTRMGRLLDSGGEPLMSADSKTVLLVEDNEDNRTVYRTILEHFGYDVVEARNGEDGIRMAREDHPDLILMDISIPVIDGWEATKILKAEEGTKHIPIIALTAHALATDRAKAEEVGCDGYLAKPCEPRRVVAEVEKFLGAGRASEA